MMVLDYHLFNEGSQVYFYCCVYQSNIIIISLLVILMTSIIYNSVLYGTIRVYFIKIQKNILQIAYCFLNILSLGISLGLGFRHASFVERLFWRQIAIAKFRVVYARDIKQLLNSYKSVH